MAIELDSVNVGAALEHRPGQGPSARSNLEDPISCAHVCDVRDAIEDVRMGEKVLPESFLGPRAIGAQQIGRGLDVHDV